jgi:metal-sulfur cluster biosynthetic enzyme
MPDKVTQEEVYSALRKCMDPEIPVNVVDYDDSRMSIT